MCDADIGPDLLDRFDVNSIQSHAAMKDLDPFIYDAGKGLKSNGDIWRLVIAPDHIWTWERRERDLRTTDTLSAVSPSP